MYTFESATVLTKNIADLCTNLLTIVITASIVLFIIYLRYVFCRKDEKWNKEKIQYLKSMQKKEYTWQCLLIDGAWGSGKTTHYEKYYQYIDNKPNIYISCFSASRSELIAQIIQQQFCWKLLTLNGLLAKLMESNWQIFMPKNRVVVFDDLERLHANQDNYLDLIGIIDYLKNTNKCKIILICNMSELKEQEKQKEHIFNTYMERIVDNVELVSELSDLSELFKNPKDKHHYKHVDLNSPIIQKIIIASKKLCDESKLKNLRVFKTSISDFANKLNRQYPESRKWDEKKQIIYAETFVEDLRKMVALRYLFFTNFSFFNEIIEYIEYTKSDDYTISLINKYFKSDDVKKVAEKDKKEEVKLKLEKTALGLNIEDFKRFVVVKDITEWLSIKFEEYKIAQFIFLDFNKFTKCILDSKLDIFILYKNLCNKYENRDKYISTKYTDWGSSSKSSVTNMLIGYQNGLKQSRENLKLTIKSMRNYKNEIIELDELRNYILNSNNFVMPLLLDITKWLPDYDDEHINIYFALAMLMHKFGLSKEKTYIINKIYFAYQKKHIRNYNYEFSKNKLKIFGIIIEKYLFWYLDSNSTLESILNLLENDFKIILTEVEQQNDRKI